MGQMVRGGPHASNLGQIVRGPQDHRTTCIKFGSNGKGGPQASNLGQIVRGDHRHQIWVKW